MDATLVEVTGPFDAQETSISAAAIAKRVALIWSFMVNSGGFDAWKNSVVRCVGLIKQSCIRPLASLLDHGLTRAPQAPLMLEARPQRQAVAPRVVEK